MVDMNSRNSDRKPGDPPVAGKKPAEDAQGAASAQESAGEGARTVQDVIAALQAESADFRDKWLRAQAEFENLRKRSEREKEDVGKYAISRLAHDIVNVGDNFQRAIEAVPAAAAEDDPALKSLLDGVRIIERELLNALERYGIKRMQPISEAFNPHLHQAVMEVPRTDIAAGLVVQVFQPGYTIEDRVLRPAMVGVSKGGAKLPSVADDLGSNGVPPANENAPPNEG
jgi:molecular chaperone GrpE